jgi:hypothetical protein
VPIFDDNKTTLKEVSKDDHAADDVFMTESTLTVVDFDSVKSRYVKALRLSETPKSNDALFLDNRGNYYFIEFKNACVRQLIPEIKQKIYDSLLIFTDIIGKGISFTRENMNYILVYNETKNPKDAIIGNIRNRTKESHINFGLGRFEKLYFKKVSTLTEKDFEIEFVSKFSSDK